MMASKNHDEYCKYKHTVTTGCCHMTADCEECKSIWSAATIAMQEKLNNASASNQQLRAEIAAIVKRCKIDPKAYRHYLISEYDLCRLVEISAE